MTDAIGRPVWVLIRLQKMYGSSITRIAKCQEFPLIACATKYKATYRIWFYDHPCDLQCYWNHIKHGEDVVVELLRDIAEHMTFKMSSDRNDWTVSTEIIDEYEAIECRIALEVV